MPDMPSDKPVVDPKEDQSANLLNDTAVFPPPVPGVAPIMPFVPVPEAPVVPPGVPPGLLPLLESVPHPATPAELHKWNQITDEANVVPPSVIPRVVPPPLPIPPVPIPEVPPVPPVGAIPVPPLEVPHLPPVPGAPPKEANVFPTPIPGVAPVKPFTGVPENLPVPPPMPVPPTFAIPPHVDVPLVVPPVKPPEIPGAAMTPIKEPSSTKEPLENDPKWVSQQEHLLRQKLGLSTAATDTDIHNAVQNRIALDAKTKPGGSVPAEDKDIIKMMLQHDFRIYRKQLGLPKDASEKEIFDAMEKGGRNI